MLSEKVKNKIIATYRNCNEFNLIADGISMLPIIAPGDGLFVQKQQQYLVGDIIAFINPGTNVNNIIVVHRIINKDNYRFFTKGDNQAFCDPPICAYNILGKIITICKKAGEKNDFLYNR